MEKKEESKIVDNIVLGMENIDTKGVLLDTNMKFRLTDVEEESYKKWSIDHKCDASFSLMGGRFTFSFNPTGIGVNTSISCVCGERLEFDVADDW